MRSENHAQNEWESRGERESRNGRESRSERESRNGWESYLRAGGEKKVGDHGAKTKDYAGSNASVVFRVLRAICPSERIEDYLGAFGTAGALGAAVGALGAPGAAGTVIWGASGSSAPQFSQILTSIAFWVPQSGHFLNPSALGGLKHM